MSKCFCNYYSTLLLSFHAKRNCCHCNDVLQNHKRNALRTNGNTDFFDTVSGVLKGDKYGSIFVYNLPRPRTTNVNRTNKNGFTLKNGVTVSMLQH